ncbi:MAG: CRISPR-associated helicase Cas3', partial [Bryobacterales bacterium]|nr:CRISPR-associated helicase Cas3' [Bryobacterales bacterium]
WCSPMRTLVDQVSDEVRRWMVRLETAGIDPCGLLPRSRDVHVLMGGVDSAGWLDVPEKPSILVGTQDMLLSRALMRGYASSRALWPMEFATLHQDTQWVFDEVQLMGAGLATSAQLEAFRHHESVRNSDEHRTPGRPCQSLWISATLEPEWLETVDHSTPTEVMRIDPATEGDSRLVSLAKAPKHLRCANAAPESSSARHEKQYLAQLARSVIDAHRTGRMTLVIVNQVKRAQALYSQIRKILPVRNETAPELVLIHSRFRLADRVREMEKLPDAGAQSDTIVIATQAVEAGLDISAGVMFTELAPWASMVQRFGRANRRAEVEGGAQVYWIDLLGCADGGGRKAEKQAAILSRPYEVDELQNARDKLSILTDVAPAHLPPPGRIDPPLRVIRRKDLDDLFDTDADLTGFDVDVSPFVRDAEDTDIRVFWRESPASGDAPPKPSSRELCAVPIGMAQEWVVKAKKKCAGPVFFARDPQWRRGSGQTLSSPPGWVRLLDTPSPGLTLLADVKAGGYRMDLGFTGDPRHIPASHELVESEASARSDQHAGEESAGHDDDPRSETGYPVPLSGHLRHVAHEVTAVCEALGLNQTTRRLLTRAACWHDLGKAHEVFQNTMRRGLGGQSVSEEAILAKTVKPNLRHNRAYFRHELVSALAFLASENWSRDADLAAFLIVAHHGKVRMNLRALPRESPPKDPERGNSRFARGVWEGDRLPAVELGGNESWNGGSLTLSVMELGWDETTKASWTERTRELLARLGPFQLAWLETLLRIADWRASRKETTGEYEDA